jgi:hypothetical protein
LEQVEEILCAARRERQFAQLKRVFPNANLSVVW